MTVQRFELSNTVQIVNLSKGNAAKEFNIYHINNALTITVSGDIPNGASIQLYCQIKDVNDNLILSPLKSTSGEYVSITKLGTDAFLPLANNMIVVAKLVGTLLDNADKIIIQIDK